MYLIAKAMFFVSRNLYQIFNAMPNISIALDLNPTSANERLSFQYPAYLLQYQLCILNQRTLD